MQPPSTPSSNPQGWTKEEITAWRHRIGMTQAAAAEVLGVHLHAYKKWEYGTRRVSVPMRRLAESIERDRLNK
ncbi:DNA-binding transcriptional regulator [Acidisphaera sp. S103]|uniref:helix-turn-helix domain-containing protein n=1 Tax=Acidisphaera sp. S103 TaxID=1747223 RepID=UPI00131BDD03|nr:helix-turn-helix transcriptional regulator [Acidisphaera sp. S103]